MSATATVAHTEEISFPLGERKVRGALALPTALAEAAPAVVVLHEILGLNDDIRRIARRFAEAGYVAMAPDLFDGLGPAPLCILRAVAGYRRGGGPAFDVVRGARAWLAARPDVDPARIGVAGFCMGGGFALLLGTRGEVGVTATFYGDVPRRAESLRGICPVVAGYGGQDRWFAAHGRRLADHLAELGVPHDVRIYPDAGHSFMSHHEGLAATIGAWGPLRAGHHAEAAEDSWNRMLAFFGRHLGMPARREGRSSSVP